MELIFYSFWRANDEYQRIFKDEYQIAELLAGLELFGLITIDHTKPDVGGGWKIKGLTLTQTGQFIFRVLEVDDKEAIFNRAYLRETGDSLFDDFQDYFPQLKKRYVVTKSKNSNRTGIYFFKVSLEGAWRRVAVRHQATLDDLADVILTAFDFDSDHLYSFRFLDTAGLKREYLHPMAMDAEAFSDEITLAELPLSLKGSMKFIFDFGDWWEFNVLLEKVEEDYPLADDKIAKLVTEKGEAPEQYPDWDEE